MQIANTTRHWHRYALRTVAAIFIATQSVYADAPPDFLDVEVYRRPAVLLQGIGQSNFPVTCTRKETQLYINQGMALLHSFDRRAAESAFHQAARLEPDCAMAWWGLAATNLSNADLASRYITRSVQNLGAVSVRERLWIECLRDYIVGSGDEKSRRIAFLQGLDRLATTYPDDSEAIAFVIRQSLENRSTGASMPLRAGVEALISQVQRMQPDHPAAIYRIWLWEQEAPERALGAAEFVRTKLAGAPCALTMAGRLYSRLGKQIEAIECFQKSAAASIERVSRDRSSLAEADGAIENLELLARHLKNVGRVHDAMTIAIQLIGTPVVSIPSKPSSNSDESQHNSMSAIRTVTPATIGRRLLLDILVEFQMWDPILSYSEAAYFAGTDSDCQSRHAHALGMARFWLGQHDGLISQIAELRGLVAQQPDELGSSAERLQQVETASFLEELILCDKLVRNQTISATEFARVPLSRRGRLLARSKKFDEAIKTATEAVAASPDQVAPRLELASILKSSGDDAAATREHQGLATVFPHCDTDLPVLKRLGELATSENQRSTNRSRITDVLPGFNSSQMAPEFSLPNRHDQRLSLRDLRGKAVLVVFYLGAGCPHCIEQLQSFSPLKEDFERADISVIAVSTDSVAGLQESFKVTGAEDAIPFRLVSDQGLKAFEDFGVVDQWTQKPLHGSFLIDPHGAILWRYVGREPFMATKPLLKEACRVLNLRAGWGREWFLSTVQSPSD